MVKYKITCKDRKSHFVQIEAVYPNAEGILDLYMPLWRPGRYERADFDQNINQISAITATGEDSTISKIKSNQWQIRSNAASVVVRYEYYANKMDAGNSVVNERQFYFNFISCLLFDPAQTGTEIELYIDLPEGYRSICSLNKTKKNTFHASNFHELADSPFMASPDLKVLEYSVGGCVFKLCFQGNHPLEEQHMLDEFRAFTKKQMTEMESFPCQEYLFLIQSLTYKHYHGVEHENCTVLVLGPNNQESHQEYREKLMGVASHELFHAWNVKKIRPREMSPYRYHEEIQFDTGVIAEGITTYYGDHFLVTSGVFDTAQYLKEVSTLFNRHFQNFGRFRNSLLASSRRLWVDGYKAVFPSQRVSIYVKGALTSLILDLAIRKESNHKHRLLDVVKESYKLYTYEQGGYSWADFKNLIFKFGGQLVLDLAETLVETTAPIEEVLSDSLAFVGCTIETRPHADQFTAGTGAKVQEGEIVDILTGSWAENRLSIGDKILKINSNQVDNSLALESGQIIELERDGEIHHIEFSAHDSPYYYEYHVSINEGASQDQIENRDRWLSI